jgi:predicted nucleic acid-binding protein
MIDESRQAGLLTLEWVTPEVHASAWEIFQRYDDQVFSFCDCTSFALCRSRNVDFVFGFDSDYRKVGLELRP